MNVKLFFSNVDFKWYNEVIEQVSFKKNELSSPCRAILSGLLARRWQACSTLIGDVHI
jgi:hypothetical protein